MTTATVTDRSDVQAVLAWAEAAFEEAAELPEHPLPRRGASDIEVYAASPSYWVGALEVKMLYRLGLSIAEVDQVLGMHS